ncbi:unnamed protein product [Linum trigynum]|uniref:Uncharacterized protein n=1 Tax=Linum trigynum TaxID=586398 RepID=A0AAV2G5H1_9ROSI
MDGFSSSMPSGVQASGHPYVIRRPEGRDKQKKNKRGGADGNSTMEAFQKIMEDMATSNARHDAIAELREAREKAREEREKAKEAREKIMHEEKIMNMDLS